MRKLGYEGEKLIKHYESCLLEAYQDGNGVWTIGWGNTYYENGRSVKKGDKIPQWRADELFKHIATSKANKVNELTEDIELMQWQFDALVSFAWNAGTGEDGLGGSKLLKVIRDNPKNYRQIDKQFMRWKYDNGIVIQGLINRRKSESWLYCNNELRFFN